MYYNELAINKSLPEEKAEIKDRLKTISKLINNMEETENNFDLLEVYVEDLLHKIKAYRKETEVI